MTAKTPTPDTAEWVDVNGEPFLVDEKVAEALGESRAQVAELTAHVELDEAERSSMFGAVDILFKALEWKSGGLAAAAHELTRRLVLARDNEARYFFLRDECASIHAGFLKIHYRTARREVADKKSAVDSAIDTARGQRE